MSENPQDPDQSTDTPKSESGTSEADADHSGDTTSPDHATLGGISDDQLPDDLQPGEDNPLAEPLDPDAEETKSKEELEMDATQEDLGNPPVESSSDSDSDSAPDTGEDVDDESDQSDGPPAG